MLVKDGGNGEDTVLYGGDHDPDVSILGKRAASMHAQLFVTFW